MIRPTRAIARVRAVILTALLAAGPAAVPTAAPALAAQAPSLSAQASAVPAPTADATFGIQPSGPLEPDARAQFHFGATKGAVIRDQVAISNYSTLPVTLKVYASDAFNTVEGGFDLLAGDRKPVDVGAWTVTSSPSVTVPGRGRVIVPFTVTLPANVTPGDHVGGVVASLSTLQTDAQGNKVAVDQRVGVRIYLRVPGLLRATLTVDGLTADYRAGGVSSGGSVLLTYTVRNTGNVRLSGRQMLTVDSPLWAHISVPSLPDLPELLPGSELRFGVTVPHAPPVGLLTATLRVDPTPMGADLNPTLIAVERSTTFWAVSWVTLVAAGFLLLLVLAAILLLLRRRRRRDGATPSGPTPPVRRDHVPALTP